MNCRVVPVLAVTLCLGLGACGSSSSSSSSTSTSSAAAGGSAQSNGVSDQVQAARVKAAACMRAQGIDIPDPSRSPASILAIYRIIATYPNTKVQSALNACAAEIRQAFPNVENATPAQLALRRKALTVFSQCMRARGINYPDPATQASDPAGYFGAIGSLPINSPAFRTASTSCRAQAIKAVSG
jgi:hypothetical protein